MQRKGEMATNKFSVGIQGEKVGQAFASCYLESKYCMARIVSHYILCSYSTLH